MCVLPQINRNPHIRSRSCYCHPNGVNGLFRNKIAVPTYLIRSFTESDDSFFIFKLLVASIYHFQHIDFKKKKVLSYLVAIGFGCNEIRLLGEYGHRADVIRSFSTTSDFILQPSIESKM